MLAWASCPAAVVPAEELALTYGATLFIVVEACSFACAAATWSPDQIWSSGWPGRVNVMQTRLVAVSWSPAEHVGPISLFWGPIPMRRVQLWSIGPLVECMLTPMLTEACWFAVRESVLLGPALLAFWYAVVQSNLMPIVTLRM